MVGFACVCLAGVGLAGGGPQAGGATFQEKVTVPANLGFSVVLSPDKKVATVIFDNLLVSVNDLAQPSKKATTTSGPPADQTRVVTKTATLHLPIETDKKSVTATLDVRGFASAGPGATARLVVCAGDQTHVVKLARSDVTMKGKLKEGLQARGRKIDGDFQERIRFQFQVHAAKPVCPVTAFLVVEHDTDRGGQGGALLAVDSFDFSFDDGTVAK